MSFDYYGNDLRTRQDWECEEMMEGILDRYFSDTPHRGIAKFTTADGPAHFISGPDILDLPPDQFKEITGKDSPEEIEIIYLAIPTEDMDILSEYAPRLFNTTNMSDEDLKRAMRTLAEDVSRYRYDKFKVKKVRAKGGRMKNKSQKERERQIKEHAKAIFEIAGVPIELISIYADGENRALFQELKKIIDDPSPLFPEHWTPYGSYTLTDIKKLLLSMKLPGKTNAIEDFIDALRKNPPPSEY